MKVQVPNSLAQNVQVPAVGAAVGVAVATHPGLLLADEPTSQLDHDARGLVLDTIGRINREIGGDLRLSAFRHRSVWNARLSRVEMHLQSREGQVVHVAGRTFAFDEGETLHTESAYKWDPRAFDALAAISGWASEASWTDDRAWFAVRVYRAR